MSTSKSLDASKAPDGAGRETARRAKTRERLLDAAYRQFYRHGINGTSIEAITDDAGFTRGAFYSNFASKEELFLALAERENRLRLATLQERFGELIAPLARVRGKPGPEALQGVLADVLACQPESRQWCLLNSEFRLLAMRDPEVAPRFLAGSRAFRQELTGVIDAAMESVGLRFTIDTLHLTTLLLAHFESSIEEAILSGSEDAEQTAREAVMQTLPSLVHSLAEVRD